MPRSKIVSEVEFSRGHIYFFNPWQPRTLLQLKLVGILTINLFLT
jgi:hypothetical protein